MERTENSNESLNTPVEQSQKHFYAIYSTKGNLSLTKTNLPETLEGELQKGLKQRLVKALLFYGQGAIIFVDSGIKEEESPPAKAACYYYYTKPVNSTEDFEERPLQYLICFISDHEEPLDLFHADLDNYSVSLLPYLKADAVATGNDLPAELTSQLESWHSNAVEYLNRCQAALQDNLKYFIHSALLNHKLVTSGGTTELQTDLQRFYTACSLSDILSRLKEVRALQDGNSLSGSVDMLTDASSSSDQADSQATLTVSITEDSIKLDSNGCNKFCEEWANNLNRPECNENPAKQKQIIEIFKLKFIQTMNTLKRLLREADNDHYALYRSYRFLRNSGNNEILLHYITAESGSDLADVLQVLQEFIQEQHL